MVLSCREGPEESVSLWDIPRFLATQPCSTAEESTPGGKVKIWTKPKEEARGMNDCLSLTWGGTAEASDKSACWHEVVAQKATSGASFLWAAALGAGGRGAWVLLGPACCRGAACGRAPGQGQPRGTANVSQSSYSVLARPLLTGEGRKIKKRGKSKQ